MDETRQVEFTEKKLRNLEIGRHLEALAAAEDASDAAEVAAKKARIRAAVAELEGEGEVERKRGALEATPAKSLVVAEPKAVVFGQQGNCQPSDNVQLSPRGAAEPPRPRRRRGAAGDCRCRGRGRPHRQRPAGARCHAGVLSVRAPTAEDTRDESRRAVILLADAGYTSATDGVACENPGLAPVFPVARNVKLKRDNQDATACCRTGERSRSACCCLIVIVTGRQLAGSACRQGA